MTAELPDGSDLGLARGTDFMHLDDLLTDAERELRDRVRTTCDEQVVPIANDYWERGEFDTRMLDVYRDLGVAGASIRGWGCAGVSPLAEGMIALELARADGSLATCNAVHSGLAMTSVHLLGDDELAFLLLDMESILIVHHRDTGGIVSAVFQAAESAYQHILSGPAADISNNSAHRKKVYRRSPNRGAHSAG